MDKTFYQAYLKSPQWAIKRERYFAAKGKWCRGCRRTDGPIQLHHLTYDRLGRESLSDLIALCPKCHREVERLHYRMGRAIDRRIVLQAFLQQRKK